MDSCWLSENSKHLTSQLPAKAILSHSIIQGRVTRCAQQCQDSIMDSFSANPTQEEKDRATVMAQDCLLKCADTNIPLIKKMVERFKQQTGCL